MKTVTFGMEWTVYGPQTIELPDDIDENDEQAVREYIIACWSEIPLPDGDYVPESDRIADDVPFEINCR